ncbi:MAG: hypothetical protein ACRCYY_06145 [Trueperaceae bacterium]
MDLKPERYINTGKASRWLGISDRSVRRYCERGIIQGARQYGFHSHWLIPLSGLQNIKRDCPEDLKQELLSALSES